MHQTSQMKNAAATIAIPGGQGLSKSITSKTSLALFLAVLLMALSAASAELQLPPPVPYLSAPEEYFLGNGTVAGGGAVDGVWKFLAGPDYTCPNYLSREEIRLNVDGVEQPLTVAMHRARETGYFYGVETNGDLKITLIDYALTNESWLGRLVTVENESHSNTHVVGISAAIQSLSGKGRNFFVTADMDHVQGIGFTLDTSLTCARSFCPNWAVRRATIAFNDPASTVEQLTTQNFVLHAPVRSIKPDGSADFTLYHYFSYEDKDDGFKNLARRNSRKDIKAGVAAWQHWFTDVPSAYSLDRIPAGRARDLVEGGLAILKMNQSCDGGIVANERGWNMSYVRDAYCGLRGLGAFGHFDEAKRFIQWLDHQYSAHGLIPNAAPSGSDTYAHPSGNNGRICPEANASVEVTALYLLAARDYYQETHDLTTLTRVDKSLRYAMDIQLKQAVNNGYRLEFNGDETELCGASDVEALRREGFNRNLSLYWSMTSVALGSASLEFYIRYLRMQGSDPANYLNQQDHRQLNLNEELGRLQDALERDFWRTNVPACPDGFHDWFRIKSNEAWPSGPLVNFTLFPVYYGTPLKYPERARCDVDAMKQYFDASTRLLPVAGVGGHRSLGHDLGYLLWGLTVMGDPQQSAVYDALINGPTACCWGAYHEAYAADGTPNANSLRTFETGVNLSAIGKFWHIGGDAGH